MTPAQKTPFLILFNASMILRSVSKSKSLGKKLSENYKNRKIRIFRKETFSEFKKLIKKIDKNNLEQKHIHDSIKCISKNSHTSFGQAQKGLNVLLKYYCHLIYHNKRKRIVKELDCPLDSFILKELHQSIFLNHMNEEMYMAIQKSIPTASRIVFDYRWDKKKIIEAKI